MHVLERARLPRAHVGESLPPKVAPLLAILGVAERIDAAGFERMRGTTIARGNGIDSHDFHPGGALRGYQVDRARFDRILIERAREVGATVLEEAAFTGVLREGSRVVGVCFSHGGGAEELRARFVVDASGTPAVVSRALGMKRRDAIRTVALSAYWEGTRAPVTFPATNTLFEMVEDGWVWSLLRADGLRNVTLGLDPATLQTAGVSKREVYLERVRDGLLVAPLLEGARLTGTVEIADATWSSAERYAGDGFLFAGDAASTIDPLTSQGVYKALQSGIVGAAAINTCLSRPEDAALALVYYQASQEEFQRNYAEIALDLLSRFTVSGGALLEDAHALGGPGGGRHRRGPHQGGARPPPGLLRAPRSLRRVGPDGGAAGRFCPASCGPPPRAGSSSKSQCSPTERRARSTAGASTLRCSSSSSTAARSPRCSRRTSRGPARSARPASAARFSRRWPSSRLGILIEVV